MFTIKLQRLRFFAYHGLYESEQINGNDFEVNVDLQLNATVSNVKWIEDTVDYSSLYALIEQRMQIPTPLLETLSEEIANTLLEFDARIMQVHIEITKLQPPIANFNGAVTVCYSKAK
ncbi:MAG: dihydroneopterin aldolase [Bacteroidota bacterium]|jgi:dihydroneopterin aldolase